MKKYKYMLITIAIILILWTAFSLIFNSVASPRYEVLEKKDGYEIRMYEPYITAQVEVVGSYDDALNQGFRILADYIFGNNTKQIDVAMTAPVTEKESEKLAMTAPVLVKDGETAGAANSEEKMRTISFVMPFEYTLESLPRPNNPEVKIISQPPRKVAALRFSWFRNSARVENKKQELISFLERDGVMSKSLPEYAGYNAPLTAPWLNRNEIIIEVE